MAQDSFIKEISVKHSGDSSEISFSADLEHVKRVANMLLAAQGDGADVEEIIVSVTLGFDRNTNRQPD